MSVAVDEVTTETPPETKQRLNLDVKVETKSSCERHVVVAIPREDVERYLSDAYGELLPKAEVPGFRPGKAPRKLVENKFRGKVEEQVKGALLLDSLQQITDEQKFSAISEPDLDFGAVVLPVDGPMTFEFNLEVRPEFQLPEWKGLKLDCPAYEYEAADIDHHMERLVGKYGHMVPYERPIKAGDFAVVNVSFSLDGNEIRKEESQTFRILKKLSFEDAVLEGFDSLMVGAQAGDTRAAKVKVSEASEDEALRGKEVDIVLQVVEVKQLELPRMTKAILEEMGGFETEEELRAAVKEELERQFAFHQNRHLRGQVTGQLLRGATWDLPKNLLQRQSKREIDRLVMELQSSGFTDEAIRAKKNEIFRHGMNQTAVALKEHFILERIAEENSLEASAQDFEDEIDLIADQADESPRKVRARLEKSGQMDSLRNQIVERKVIQLILSHAEVKDVPFKPEEDSSHAVEFSISTKKAAIPDAKYGNDAEDFRAPKT